MKTIKFNLSYGDERIKSLAELKENCNVDMLLETLENGLFHRWLLSQGEAELAEKVEKIDKSNHRQALSHLLKLLFDRDASTMEEAVAELFAVREKEVKRLESLNNLAAQEKEIIAQYHAGYEAVLKSLKEHGTDYALLKAQMTVLNTQYRKLLELDKARFYSIFETGYPLVLLSLMANAQLRDIIGLESEVLYKDVIKEITGGGSSKKNFADMDLEEIRDRIQKGNKNHPAVLIENEIQLDKFKAKYSGKCLGCIYENYQNSNTYDIATFPISVFTVGNYYVPPISEFKTQSKSALKVAVPHIKKFSGKTDSYWKDIEPRGKQFMIIKMEKGNKLRNSGASGEELKADDINGKFIFTNGIDYMSNSDSDELIYMEV